MMLSEWSAECSADDPVLVVPWSDSSDSTGNRRFIDLRENPYDLDHLPEAEHYPPLMHALRALNAARSPVFTATTEAPSGASRSRPIQRFAKPPEFIRGRISFLGAAPSD